jgi:hypothetical protein
LASDLRNAQIRWSKWTVEKMVSDFQKHFGFSSFVFNVVVLCPIEHVRRKRVALLDLDQVNLYTSSSFAKQRMKGQGYLAFSSRNNSFVILFGLCFNLEGGNYKDRSIKKRFGEKGFLGEKSLALLLLCVWSLQN